MRTVTNTILKLACLQSAKSGSCLHRTNIVAAQRFSTLCLKKTTQM